MPPPPPTTSIPLIGAKPGVTVEVAPGRRVELHAADPLPSHCIADLIPIGGGTYKCIPRLAPGWMNIGQSTLRRLGINLSETTMHRLGRAGLIQTRHISPFRYEFNFSSWLAHCAVVEADPEFWEQEVVRADGKKTNRQRYREAL